MKKLDRITIDARKCGGQPTVRGLRITVSLILKMLACGKSSSEVLLAYPELEQEDILQAMEYAAWMASEHVQLDAIIAV